MAKRKVFVVEKCVVCGDPIEQKARGRPRLTCKGACKQARHRFNKEGKSRKHMKKVGKRIEKRRNQPFIERSFNKDYHEPVLTLSFRRWVYECLACGQPYIVERIRSGSPINPYCSETCEKKTDYHWKKFGDALAQSSMSGRRVDPRVLERLDYNKLSPLCPRCGRPFPPNTTLYGERKPGRPRKYCSGTCRVDAFDQRWKNRTGRARKHRYADCAECGTRFDRVDARKQRVRRFCGDACADRWKGRARYAREVAKAQGRVIKGWRAATLSAPKNKAKRAIRNKNGVEALGAGV